MENLCERGQDVVVMFARAAAPGRVKSRLLTHLTPEQACRLHRAATHDTAELLAGVVSPAVDIACWLFWSEAPPARGPFAVPLPSSFRAALQQGGSLGDRMAEALQRALASGARRVVLLGSDSPHLPPERIPQALVLLDSHDVVLGPAEDGGFYLIGCRRFDSRLFDGVEWGSPRAFQQTAQNAARLGFTTELLEPWYDLDEWKDLQRMVREAREGRGLPRHLAAFLQQLKQEKGGGSLFPTAAPDEEDEEPVA